MISKKRHELVEIKFESVEEKADWLSLQDFHKHSLWELVEAVEWITRVGKRQARPKSQAEEFRFGVMSSLCPTLGSCTFCLKQCSDDNSVLLEISLLPY